MKKILCASVILSGLFVSGVSFAQDDSKMQSIVFDDDRIEGDLMMPTSSTLNAHELEELSSLIKAREDFVDEMRKTVDEL